MSHPVPGHDNSEQFKGESNRAHSHRRRTAIGLNKTQKVVKRILREAGESFRKPDESYITHIKRLNGETTIAKAKALKKKIGRKETEKERREQMRGEEASDFERGN